MSNNKLAGNIISLFTLKGAEYIISFITLPYLLRVLGPEKYGAIAFVQVIINYGVLLVDYGFNLTAPRDIARVEASDRPRHFSAIMGAKIAILTIILLIGIVIFSTIQTTLDIYLLVCMLPMLIGNVMFPIWYFQGIQQMKFITVFNIMARIVSVSGIFILVQSRDDYLWAAFLQSFTPLLAGIIAMLVLLKQNPSLFCLPSLVDIKEKLYDGWDIFISTLFINLYTNSNIFILGLMTNDIVVGYYAAASKLVDAVKGLFSPISNAIFPHVSVLFKESKEKAVNFLCSVLRIIGGLSFTISLLVFVFAEQIAGIVMGQGYEESIFILQIISFLPFIIGLSNIFGIQTMVAMGMKRVFSRILMLSALLNFILVFPFVYMWQGIGLAMTVVIVECFVTITMYIALRKNNIVLL